MRCGGEGVVFHNGNVVQSLLDIVLSGPTREKLDLAIGRLSPHNLLHISGLDGSLPVFVALGFVKQTGRQLLLVARDQATVEQYQDDLRLLGDPNNTVCAFRENAGLSALLPAGIGGTENVETLHILVDRRARIVVTHGAALSQALPNPSSVSGNILTVVVDSKVDYAELINRLLTNRFEKKDFVEAPGDFSVRGGILDVFPFTGEHPVRIEFSGDLVESIREIDPISQRSIKPLSSAAIVPNLLADPISDRRISILDFLEPNALIMVHDSEHLREEVEKHKNEAKIDWTLLEEQMALFTRIHVRTLSQHPDSEVNFKSLPQPSFNANVPALKRDLSERLEDGYKVLIACHTQSERIRLKDLLALEQMPISDANVGISTAHVDVSRLEFVQQAIHEGFVLPDARLVLYTEHQIFNRLKRRGRRRRPRFTGVTDRELRQLRRGDFVVHEDFGIGMFSGLEKIRVRNVEQEVVKLLYGEKDKLYVNLNYVNKIQKYSSKEGHTPVLTRLGSQEWNRLKSRAKHRIKDIARDLIKLYASRKRSQGFAFAEDTLWQKELEASFMYEDTFDQAKATIDVKRDMEAPYPMDRLICGDVGFGKTEVAIRAAFKAVMSGKQVAVLVPTTILALQHFNTFVDRMGRYSVNIEVVSRLKSRKEQQHILERLKSGMIDVIIGTHRLLSKDVVFKDIGLVIVDEEHRFGVSSKEKLRQLRAEVDTLTLTATPIPRTLHFSLMGARDLSIIATPPRNRLPVVTDIVQYDEEFIKEVVTREIQRNGQIYFVHDRVQGIEEVASKLRRLLPGARVGVAHGQMAARELEHTMLQFLEKKSDLLVCTKIIESGLDIPNVNTIIINRADRFGMAELYQLRGRVGRSNAQAYAYLLAPSVSLMPRGTIQRLQAIEEFVELGSGFNLAMRDLEIRGAGNLLGAEQSGFIESMGFETYTRVLDEAVGELKEEEFKGLFQEAVTRKQENDVVIEADLDAFIPDRYIPRDVDRLEIYRRLYSLTTKEQLAEVASEMTDRFGKLPFEVQNLFDVIEIRLLASLIGFKKVGILRERLEFELPPSSDTSFYETDGFDHLMASLSHLGPKHASLAKRKGSLCILVPVSDANNGQDLLGLTRETMQTLSYVQPQTSPA